jgi:TonB family protein
MLRVIVQSLLCFLISGCSQQPAKAPPPVSIGISRAPSLLPGCAVPDAALIAENAPLELVMTLAVDNEGSVTAARVTKASRSAELDQAFVAAARKCLFAPALLDNKPTTATRELSFVWQSSSPPSGINRCFLPDYPRQATRADAQGIAEVQFIFVNDTTPPDVRLVRSSGSSVLDKESVLSATLCLSTASVRQSLKLNQYYRQAISWILQ